MATGASRCSDLVESYIEDQVADLREEMSTEVMEEERAKFAARAAEIRAEMLEEFRKDPAEFLATYTPAPREEPARWEHEPVTADRSGGKHG